MSDPVPPDAEQELVEDPSGGRRSRILGGSARRIEGLRTVVTALISTLVFFAVVTYVVLHSPNWAAVIPGTWARVTR